MNIQIEGNGSFGSFLRELLPQADFNVVDDAESVILAVPISAYDELGERYRNRHLINVCSVQKPSTDILLRHTNKVTSIHPLFGKRTPSDKRNSIITYRCNFGTNNKNVGQNICKEEYDFIDTFKLISKIITASNREEDIMFTPEIHDKLMAKTHLAAVLAAKQCKVFIDAAQDIPDKLIPNSFRLLREFVKTLDDMPSGTIESILANPYA